MQQQPASVTPTVGARITSGFLILFSLPFIGGGLLALSQGIKQFGSGANAIVLIIVGVVFTAAGLLLVWGVRYGTSVLARKNALKARYPGQPWMWRNDWAERSIKESTRGRAVGLWIFAFFWNAISFPIALLVGRQELIKGNHAALLVFLFPLIGVIVVIVAIYQTVQAMKFGTSTCHLDNVPIVPGRRFRGDIEVSVDAAPSNGFHVRIASIRAVTTGSGKSRSTTEHLLWDAEIVIDAAAAMRSPMGTRIPFELATPPDSHVTDERDSNDRYFWRLSAAAELPGVDYSAQFELPVFQTGEEVDGSEFTAFDQRHRAEAARHELPQSSGIRITPRPAGGDDFRLHAKRTVGRTLQSLLILAAWNAAVGALIYFHAPTIASMIFIAIDLLLIFGTVDYFLGETTVTVTPSGVIVRREWLGTGHTKSFDAGAIASIDGTTAGAGSTSFGVTLKLRNGTTRLLAQYLPDRESADIVAAKMMADLKGA